MAEKERKAAAEAAGRDAESAGQRGAESPGPEDEDGGCLPDVVDGWLAPMIYPKGSFRVSERTVDRVTDEQWAAAAELLGQGFVVGFPADASEAPDFACELAQRCTHFRIAASYTHYLESSETVFFVKV